MERALAVLAQRTAGVWARAGPSRRWLNPAKLGLGDTARSNGTILTRRSGARRVWRVEWRVEGSGGDILKASPLFLRKKLTFHTLHTLHTLPPLLSKGKNEYREV